MNVTSSHNIGIALSALCVLVMSIFLLVPTELSETDSASTSEIATIVPEESTESANIIETSPEIFPDQSKTSVIIEDLDTIVESAPASEPEQPVSAISEPIIDTVVESNQYAASILAGHNSVRQAKGLQSLSWSAVLADSASDWAANLAARGCILEHSDSPYGENLYYAWTTGEFRLDPKPAVTWWAAEEGFYDYQANACDPGEQCGHYTQMVWKDTTHVGCAVVTCSNNDRNTQLWVCQYDPPGNTGDRPY